MSFFAFGLICRRYRRYVHIRGLWDLIVSPGVNEPV